jgi:hypothetical protein
MCKFICIAIFVIPVLALAAAAPKPVDEVLNAYVQAVGGASAIDRVESREIHGSRHHGAKLTYFWQKPNKVLLIEGKQRIGYDGGSGWVYSKKKRVSKLSKGLEEHLLMEANPLRYVHLKELYSELNAAPSESIDGRPMDVVEAPNNLGATKFYFDGQSHLLAHIEETGKTSAYFKHSTDFLDYESQDGVKFPLRIIHESNEPGSDREEIRISEISQNVPVKPDMFTRPTTSNVVLGGKR